MGRGGQEKEKRKNQREALCKYEWCSLLKNEAFQSLLTERQAKAAELREAPPDLKGKGIQGWALLGQDWRKAPRNKERAKWRAQAGKASPKTPPFGVEAEDRISELHNMIYGARKEYIRKGTTADNELVMSMFSTYQSVVLVSDTLKDCNIDGGYAEYCQKKLGKRDTQNTTYGRRERGG